ncbi:MAG: SEC-C metal-binding domain-containing protein [Bacteroidales bacterium]
MKIQPNDPCWCGSGLKYKKCHKEIIDRYEDFWKMGYIKPRTGMIKTKEEIDKIRKTGELVRNTFEELKNIVRAGISTLDIDTFVYDYTIKHMQYQPHSTIKAFQKVFALL